jgi:hypothetical protein
MTENQNVENKEQPLDISNSILEKIYELERLKKLYRQVLSETVESQSDYDKALALTIMRLRNGKEVELDGEKIKDPQAVLIERISRGICWKEKLEVEKASARIDGIKSNIQCVLAQLNGFQSINRNLSEL